ncbi:MAG: putative efflux system component YknX [Chroococcidiopsis cubana SAG 39.79]|uniref:RND transporter n=1 Tax=Chroococcidiopsis cubana SAG 39.79 TaxID=388085 RepID=A0AB37UCJ8_9CYAN|nr:putative efflux system component YknX [Chroococcidiopsis cubana SAG 39.79]PSB62398.1 efflux transporter periplasmic adaptor subunit [Chroococcidiopsis cubana CCALA 043]RUT05840.1 RND transporter [Chroococcidiopsis cubana SAG 39.79]
MSRQQIKNKLKPKVRRLLWASTLVLVSVGGWIIHELVLKQPPKSIKVNLLTAKLGTVENTLNTSGIVQLRNQQTLKSPAESAVERVFVRPGDKVKSGQVLIALRYPERQVALTQQQVQIQRQHLILARSRERIIVAQEHLSADERELHKLAALVVEGAVAQQRVQQQEDKLRTARAILHDAWVDARVAALELKSLQLERQSLQQQIQDSVVTAPFDGVVLDVSVKNGDGVERRTDLLTLGDPTQVMVKLQLSTFDATKVRVHQSACISIIGPESQKFAGIIQSLYPQAEENQRQASRNQLSQPTVPAMVRLNTPTRMLIPGSSVNVEIILAKRQNVVVLDLEAIQRSESNLFVWVNERGKAQKRFITLGLEGILTAEVSSGLHPNEQVILPAPEFLLEVGMPVIPHNHSLPKTSFSSSCS